MSGLGILARMALTTTVRVAIQRGLRKCLDEDLSTPEGRRVVCDAILVEIAGVTEKAASLGSAVLSRGFPETDTDSNPFEE